MSAAINPLNDSIIYASAQGLFLGRSDDRGATFNIITPPRTNNEITAFSGPYELAPSEPNIVYAGRQFLYRSDDHGDNWVATSTSTIDGGNVILSIAISVSNPDKLYVSTAPSPFSVQPTSSIFRSTDGGNSWTQISTRLPRRIIKDLAIDSEDDEVVHAVFSGFGSAHYARTRDGGQTWTQNNRLVDIPANTIMVDPANGDHVYLGNDLGVQFSDDGGQIWSDFSLGLSDATMAFHLSTSVSNRKIRVATHGRGIYERDLVEQLPSTISDVKTELLTMKVLPNPLYNDGKIIIQSKINSEGHLTIFSMAGNKLMTNKNIDLSIGRNEILLQTRVFASGQYSVVCQVEKSSISQLFIKY